MSENPFDFSDEPPIIDRPSTRFSKRKRRSRWLGPMWFLRMILFLLGLCVAWPFLIVWAILEGCVLIAWAIEDKS